ncbi:hypothetical protein CBL_05335 [Carabus blaptoides fortunei]
MAAPSTNYRSRLHPQCTPTFEKYTSIISQLKFWELLLALHKILSAAITAVTSPTADRHHYNRCIAAMCQPSSVHFPRSPTWSSRNTSPKMDRLMRTAAYFITPLLVSVMSFYGALSLFK